ncbi:MAG TPA: GAF domain-containing protein [Cyclobacteriaceae bacterium]
MIFFWKSISRLGISENTDFRLASRIILSNQFGLVIAFLTSVFMVLAIVNGNYNLLPFITLLVITGSIWFLNAVNLTRISRLITCLIPAVGLFILNVSVKFGAPGTVDILHYATPRMIIVGSVVLPFTMFTPSERNYVIMAVLFILSLSFGYDAIHSMLGVDHESLGLTNKHYGIITEDVVVLAIIVLLASGFLFKMGYQYDIKSQRLLSEALEQTELMKKNEDALKKTLTELESSRKKDEERNWVSKGLADLVAVIQSGDDDKKIYDRLLASLIKYMNVNQGGIFIAEETDGKVQLNLTSYYAYERKKYLQKTINPGEGLLGAAYLEGQRIYLKKVPAEYVSITSGLGEATPRALVIVPMKINNQVEGLIELASLTDFQEHHFELLDQLCETLASFITNNKINVRTKILLEKAQTMSEELKSNEEEMRQNLEELTATQEAMSRKEHEYRERIRELEEALEVREQLNSQSVSA